MKTKLFGFATALVLFAASQSHATTIYQFDMQAIGTIPAAGSVGVSVSGSTATFTVSLPSTYSFNELALNLNSGSVVDGGPYNVTYNAAVNFNQGKTYPNFGPFNTVLTALGGGNFGDALTFTVSNFAGMFNVTTNGSPIWFVAIVTSGGKLGAIAADASEEQGPSGAAAETPLPAALPLFATGLGAMGLLGWRKRRKATTAA